MFGRDRTPSQRRRVLSRAIRRRQRRAARWRRHVVAGDELVEVLTARGRQGPVALQRDPDAYVEVPGRWGTWTITRTDDHPPRWRVGLRRRFGPARPVSVHHSPVEAHEAIAAMEAQR